MKWEVKQIVGAVGFAAAMTFGTAAQAQVCSACEVRRSALYDGNGRIDGW